MALHRYGDFRVEVFYFDSPCTVYIDRFSVIRAAKVAVNNGNSTFFSIPKSRD